MKRAQKLTLGALAVPALGYLAACGWMYAKQRELIYLPQGTKADAQQTDFGIARNGVMLNGWLVNIGKPKAVIYFGGNAERIEDMRDEFARWFPDSSTYLVSYRGYGASEGEPSQEAILSDALAIFDQVQARQPGAPITVIGRSLGSGVASYVASQRPVARLALVTPFDSLATVAQMHYPWLPARWILSDQYPSVDYLSKYAGPLLVIRAGQDQVVPPGSTDQLLARLKRPAEIVDLAQADHSTVIADPRYGQALAKFVSAP
ncbi:MAG TPA: alpha/beta fold hydrolase [Lysobacter sp.]|nr:alpha/beta fold hydrolase [Lysobacter sp.]